MMDTAPAYLESPAASQAYLTLQRAAQDVLSGIIGRHPTVTFLGRRPVPANNLGQSGKNVLVELQFEQPKDIHHSILVLADDADLARLFGLSGDGEEVLTAEALLSLGDMFSSFLDAIAGELPWLSPAPRAWLANLEPMSTDTGGNTRFDLPTGLAPEEILHEIVVSVALGAEESCALLVVIGEKGEQALLGLNAAPPAPAPAAPRPAPVATPMPVLAPTSPAPAARPASNVQSAAFKPLAVEQPAGRSSSIDLIRDVPLKVTVELGRASLTVREILALGAGSVVELDRLAGEPVDVLVNDRMIARGEVVIVDESFGVRITDLMK
ncbi:MAG TPA: flagellar motor switch protein FliN [Chloroflexota bacterium]|nr:flagellar motor switch protein FliN [Chloroflexota bacterium]